MASTQLFVIYNHNKYDVEGDNRLSTGRQLEM